MSLLTRFIFSVVSLIQVTAVTKTITLSRDYPLQTQDCGWNFLEPIDSDDGGDDDDDGGGGSGGGGGGGGSSSSSGGAGIGGGYRSVGDKEGNTLTTHMVAIH